MLTLEDPLFPNWDQDETAAETFARYFIHDPVHHLHGVTVLRVSGNH
jgi:hypothetical protein